MKGRIVEQNVNSTELAALRQALSQHPKTAARDAVAFELLRIGVRVSELSRLAVPVPVTLADGTRALFLEVSVSKTSHESGWCVTLVGTAWEAVERLLVEREALEGPLDAGEALFADSGPFAAPDAPIFNRRLAAACAAAGISHGVDVRSLRRGALTMALAAGIGLEELAKFTRPGSPRTTYWRQGRRY